MLTGWRAGEVLSLRRDYIDRTRREARLPDTKTGHSVQAPVRRSAGTARWAAAHRRLALLLTLRRRCSPVGEFPALCWAASSGCASVPASATPAAHVIRHRIVTDIAGAAPNLRTGMMLSGPQKHGRIPGLRARGTRAGQRGSRYTCWPDRSARRRGDACRPRANNAARREGKTVKCHGETDRTRRRCRSWSRRSA